MHESSRIWIREFALGTSTVVPAKAGTQENRRINLWRPLGTRRRGSRASPSEPHGEVDSSLRWNDGCAGWGLQGNRPAAPDFAESHADGETIGKFGMTHVP